MAMDKFYTGIGSRQTPIWVLAIMTNIADWLYQNTDLYLRSGAAPGADQAFEAGARDWKKIYIPWEGFNNRYSNENDNDTVHAGVCGGALGLAQRYHPAWDLCTDGVRKLHARNVYQIFGTSLCRKSEFVICWTPDGLGGGGTGQALRIARAHDVPVLDLGEYITERDLKAHAWQFLKGRTACL
jgi:hypothetical protein